MKRYIKPQTGIHNICSTAPMLTSVSTNIGLQDGGGGNGTGDSTPEVHEDRGFSIWD